MIYENIYLFRARIKNKYLRAIPGKHQKYVGNHSNRFEYNHEICQEDKKLYIDSAFRFFIFLLVSMETTSENVSFEIWIKTSHRSNCTQYIKLCDHINGFDILYIYRVKVNLPS